MKVFQKFVAATVLSLAANAFAAQSTPIAKVIVQPSSDPLTHATYTIYSDRSVYISQYMTVSGQIFPLEGWSTNLVAQELVREITDARNNLIGAKITEASKLSACKSDNRKDFYVLDSTGQSRAAVVRNCVIYTPGGAGKSSAERLVNDMNEMLTHLF